MFARYVAIGDSQTEGLDDPDGRGGFIGWADRLAARLAQVEPAVRYANLAVRGRVTRQIHEQQLAPALALQPDLVTVVSGVNDLRRTATPISAVVTLIEDMFRQLREAGATVASCTFPDITTMIPFGERMAPRLQELNEGIRRAAQRHDVTIVDFEQHREATDPRLWSDDRIHLNPRGHALLAAAFADALGLPDAAGWQDPLPASAPTPRLRQVAGDTRWVLQHFAPAMVRHARGRSSGDGILPKRPNLEPVNEAPDSPTGG
jgi:lysophospholipase L1-like esterase